MIKKKIRVSKKKSWQIYLKTLKKQTRGRYKYLSTKNNTLSSGIFGVKALTTGRMYSKHAESMLRFITKKVRKRLGNVIKHITFNRTLTKKSTGIRMGKGKGEIKEIAGVVEKGMLLFEVNVYKKDTQSLNATLAALQTACKRSPFKTSIVCKIANLPTSKYLQLV